MSAFNGSGQFVITGTGLPFTTGTVISSTVVNQLNTDLAAGLSNCICKDGQSTPTNNIPMGGFKLTGLGAATTLGDALSYGQPANVSSLTVTGPATIGGYGAGVGRNRLINGDMRVSQRCGTGSFTTTPGSVFYTLDRWFISTSTGTINIQQGTNETAGDTTAIHLFINTPMGAGVSDYSQFTQKIEANNIGDCQFGTPNAQSLSLSFLVFANAGTYGASIANPAGTRTYPFSFVVSQSAAWNRVVVTIPGDTGGPWTLSGNGECLELRICLGAGSNWQGPAGAWSSNNYIGPTGMLQFATIASAYMALTDIQLELAPPGATPAAPLATPFERRQFGQELLLCQRYFQTSYPLGTVPGDGAAGSTVGNVAAYTTAAARVLTQFSPPMRATPGMVAYRGTNAGNNGVWNFYYPTSSAWVAGTGMSLTPNSAGGFTGQVNTNAGNFTLGLSYLIDGGWIASAEL